MAEDINAMEARLNINERVRSPSALPQFEAQPPKNPFDEHWDNDDDWWECMNSQPFALIEHIGDNVLNKFGGELQKICWFYVFD